MSLLPSSPPPLENPYIVANNKYSHGASPSEAGLARLGGVGDETKSKKVQGVKGRRKVFSFSLEARKNVLHRMQFAPPQLTLWRCFTFHFSPLCIDNALTCIASSKTVNTVYCKM